MKKTLLKLEFYFGFLGIGVRTFIEFFTGLPFYFRDYNKLKKQMKIKGDFQFGKFWPILNQRKSESGSLTFHYFYQDLFVAQQIFKNKPYRHIDIGSRIDGFVAHVAAFREIEIFDIRPLDSKIQNVVFKQADLMKLPNNMIECCDSISSLHAIEHFGLGRYGDPIDIDGHLKAFENIHKILKPNGKFYLGTPIGKQRIEFNAHRVFSVRYLIDNLSDKFIIERFSYIDDKNILHTNINLNENDISSNFNTFMGCGIFELIKK
jgi:SAM-dependent methyltransferase